MPTGRLVGIWLRDDLSCVSGSTRLATLFPNVATVWSTTATIENYLVARRCSINLPLVSELAAEVLVGRVLEFVYDNAGTEEIVEYRISRRVRRSVGSGILVCEGAGVEFDLGSKDTVVGETASGLFTTEVSDFAITPLTALTNRVLAFAPSHFALGTVTPTDTVDVKYSGPDTPLSAALKIAAAVHATTGVRYEVSVRRNGTTGYYIDLAIYQASASTPDVRTAKNLADYVVDEQGAEQTTRAYPQIAHGLWRPYYAVSAVSAGAYIEVQGLFGARGPAREDDQLNGLYAVEDKNNTAHAITDVTLIDYFTTRLAMASTTGISTGDRIYLAKNSTPDELEYLDSPAGQATDVGVKVGVLPNLVSPVTNHGLTPDLRTWSGSYPDDWVAVGSYNAPTKVTTAGVSHQGGIVARFDGTTGGSGEAMEQTRSVYIPAGWLVTYVAYLHSAAGGGNTGGLAFYDPNTGAVGATQNIPVGTYKTVAVAYTVNSAGVKTIGVQPLWGGSGSAWDLDAVMIVIAPSDLSIPADFFRGSGAAKNIAAINDYFDSNAMPIVSYEVSALDLFGLDPSTYSADGMDVGITLAITEPVTGAERKMLRIVDCKRTSANPFAPSLTLGTLPGRLSREVAAA